MPISRPRRSPRRRACLLQAGRLLVVDFAAHEREELRATDAHIRLGFADDAMAGWFAAAGLELDQVRASAKAAN